MKKQLVLAACTAAMAAAGAEIPKERIAVSDADMKAIYEEVKTPHKVGMVLLPEKGEMLDGPSVFRHGDAWYMIFITFDGKGYETHLAKSADLVKWERLGMVFARAQGEYWDSAQADGWPLLLDPLWEGPNTLTKFDGRYWMMYIGGAMKGYETDPLSTGVAWTDDPSAVKQWTRYPKNPVLSPSDPDARDFERKTIFKHYVVEDPSRACGGRFVDFYNAKQKGVWRETIGMAVSDDMLKWRRVGDGPVISDGNPAKFAISGDPMIKRIGDVWVMFYFGCGWKRKGAFDTFACSYDLKHWTKWDGKPLVEPSEPYDAKYAHKPWVIKHNGVVYHFYCAVGNKGRGIALATSKPVRGSTGTVFAEAKMPIIGWGALAAEKANAELYAEAKEAGFTHLTQWCSSPDVAKRLLAEADKAGIKLIIGLGHEVGRMTAAAEAFTAAAKDSPALEWYYITDEPHIKHAESIRDCVRRFEELDPAHKCYVNLFGALCDRWTRRDEERQLKYTGCSTHDEYIRRLYDVAPLKLISFDVYPVLSFKPLEDGDFRLHGQRVFLKERWYETLETTSAFARERGIPMLAFALVAAHRHYPANDYPVPTVNHLRLQIYSDLAYGAQGLQFFRYKLARKEFHGYNNAPILFEGQRSPVYERVREMNKEVQARAHVFLGAEVQGVWHTGIDVPLGTKRFDAKFLPPFVKTFEVPNGGTAVVSWLRNGGKDYFMVVNRDPDDDISFKATFAAGVEIVRRDGTTAPAAEYADYFWLDPGDTAIFAAQVGSRVPRGR